jgi:rubrerythrin
MEKSVAEILQEAIQGEVESYEMYTDAVRLVKAEHVQQTLEQLAREELGHKASLEKMLANPGQMQRSIRQLQQAPIQDYKIGDYLVVKPLGPDSTFQDVCIVASRKEQQSYELYQGLAEQNEGEIRDLFQAMAKDELRHKNLVEEVIYQEF